MRDTWWRAVDGGRELRDGAERWLFSERHAPVALGLCRMLIGVAVLLILIASFAERELWVGSASVWADPARAATTFPEIVLVRDASDTVVTLVYVATMLAAAALIVGWMTRLATVVTLVGFIAVVGQNPMVGNPSDNAIRLTLLWLVLTQAGARCSIDQRRRETREAMEADVAAGLRSFDSQTVLPPWLGISLHNIGLLGLVVQTVLLYTTAGFDKIARGVWRSGEALYYTTQLPEFRPFPALSEAVSASPVVLAVLTYGVLLTQLFFAPLMLTRVTRIIAAGLAIVANLFFAVVYGAPAAALAIIAVTLVVVPDDLLDAAVDRIALTAAPVTERLEDLWFAVTDRIVDGWYALTDRIREILPGGSDDDEEHAQLAELGDGREPEKVESSARDASAVDDLPDDALDEPESDDVVARS